MIRYGFFSIIFLLVSLLCAQKSVLVAKGTVAAVFQGLGGRIAVCQIDSNGETVSLLSKKMDFEKDVSITDTVLFPSNDGFADHLAFISVGAEDTATHFQSIKLKLLELATGRVLETKIAVKPTYRGKWVDQGRAYSMAGKVCRLVSGEVKIERISSVIEAEVSPDLTFCMNPVIQKVGATNIKVNIELENLINQDMLNVDAYQIKQDGAPLAVFAADPRYVYYRAGGMPTLYDVKKMQGVAIPDINYKKPEYFGYCLSGDKYYFLYDFYSVAVIDKKGLAVDEVYPSPFTEEFVEILEGDDRFVYGTLYLLKNGVKDYTKVFSWNLKKNDYKTIPLPGRTQRVFINEKKGGYLYLENTTLVFSAFNLK